MAKRTLTFVTGNANKLKEIKAILGGEIEVNIGIRLNCDKPKTFDVV